MSSDPFSTLIGAFGAGTEEEILSACQSVIPEINDYEHHAVPWLISIIRHLADTGCYREAANMIIALGWKEELESLPAAPELAKLRYLLSEFL